MTRAHKMVLVTWLAVYPLTTGLQALLGPLMVGLALPIKTLFVTLIMVPLLVMMILPKMVQVLAVWLAADSKTED